MTTHATNMASENRSAENRAAFSLLCMVLGPSGPCGMMRWCASITAAGACRKNVDCCCCFSAAAAAAAASALLLARTHLGPSSVPAAMSSGDIARPSVTKCDPGLISNALRVHVRDAARRPHQRGAGGREEQVHDHRVEEIMHATTCM